MKKLLTFIISATLAAMTFTSCEIEVDDNGDLDGYWKLTTVDTLQSGGTLDLTDSKIFWSVQKKLLDVRDLQGGYGDIVMRFNYTSDSLAISYPCISDREVGDIPLSNVDSLQPFGINDLNDKFLIEKLNGSKMTLKSNVVRLNFKKF